MKCSEFILCQCYRVTFLTVILFFCQSKGQPVFIDNGEIIKKAIAQSDTLKLVFVGDVIIHSAVYNSARSEGGDSVFNFQPMFQFVDSYISFADLCIANLEVPLGGEPYSGYPLFSSPLEIADALKKSGFNLLTIANNHVADKGKKGLEDTIDYLDRLDIGYMGAYKDSVDKEDNHPLFIEKKGIKLSFLNYTYDTNGMPVYKPNRVNTIDTLQIKQDIQKAKQQAPDFIIACIHWGYEYQNKENKEQREIALFLANNGVNLIIGGHPHVIQPFDIIHTEDGNQTPVIYSVGNFLSNQQWRYADGGVAFEVAMIKVGKQISMMPVTYEPLWVSKTSCNSKDTTYRIIPVTDYMKLPEKYSLNEEQSFKIKRFQEDTKAILSNLEYGGYW